TASTKPNRSSAFAAHYLCVLPGFLWQPNNNPPHSCGFQAPHPHILSSQSALSLMDLMYISTTLPKMAYNFLSGQKSITLLGCGEESFFFVTMSCSEGLLLASIAYNRFVAIYHPFHYPTCMSKMMCLKMIIGSWTLGSINSLGHTVYALHIPYCHSRSISHFFCDVPAMLPLACMDTWAYEYKIFYEHLCVSPISLPWHHSFL
ncbi:Olfactory receptor 2L13, partial [Lemmus lemmus]